MAHLALLFLSLLSLSLTLLSQAATPSPKALVLPLHKDAATNLLVAKIQGRTPLIPTSFVVDLTARHLWANCETNYKSSTFSEPKCGSVQCKTANTSYCHTCPKAARPFCHANTCGLLLENPVTHQSTIGEVAQDVMAFSSTDGSNPGPLIRIPNLLFTCSPSALVENGLPKGVQGVVGMAQAPIALQNQLASRLGLKPIFTMCVPASTYDDGVLFFGSEGPYTLLPGVTVTPRPYTPMKISPFGEYYINVKSIKINSKPVPVNKSLLSLADIGTRGGTTINTLLPYTVLEDSIFKAITSFFAKELAIQTAKPVAPFGLCYDSGRISWSKIGPQVPSIDLELEGKDAVWSIDGQNSMVQTQSGLLCLAFVNGGSNYRASVNIGTYQMQNIPLQFDLSRSALGVGGSLSGERTNCANFNFTTVA